MWVGKTVEIRAREDVGRAWPGKSSGEDDEGYEAIAARSWFQSDRSKPCFVRAELPLTVNAPEREVASFLSPSPDVRAPFVAAPDAPSGLDGNSIAPPLPRSFAAMLGTAPVALLPFPSASCRGLLSLSVSVIDASWTDDDALGENDGRWNRRGRSVCLCGEREEDRRGERGMMGARASAMTQLLQRRCGESVYSYVRCTAWDSALARGDAAVVTHLLVGVVFRLRIGPLGAAVGAGTREGDTAGGIRVLERKTGWLAEEGGKEESNVCLVVALVGARDYISFSPSSNDGGPQSSRWSQGCSTRGTGRCD
jgi:hypothetical protein